MIGRGAGGRSRASLAVVLLLLAASVSGCERARRPRDEAPAAEEVTVEVENNHFLDVVVHVSADGFRTRLGSVTGKTGTTLFVPGRYTAAGRGFELDVDPVGSTAGYRTGVIDANPGDVVVLNVASVLRMSSWYLR